MNNLVDGSCAATQEHKLRMLEQLAKSRELKPMADREDRDVKNEKGVHSRQADKMLPLREALYSRRED